MTENTTTPILKTMGADIDLEGVPQDLVEAMILYDEIRQNFHCYDVADRKARLSGSAALQRLAALSKRQHHPMKYIRTLLGHYNE